MPGEAASFGRVCLVGLAGVALLYALPVAAGLSPDWLPLPVLAAIAVGTVLGLAGLCAFLNRDCRGDVRTYFSFFCSDSEEVVERLEGHLRSEGVPFSRRTEEEEPGKVVREVLELDDRTEVERTVVVLRFPDVRGAEYTPVWLRMGRDDPVLTRETQSLIDVAVLGLRDAVLA